MHIWRRFLKLAALCVPNSKCSAITCARTHAQRVLAAQIPVCDDSGKMPFAFVVLSLLLAGYSGALTEDNG